MIGVCRLNTITGGIRSRGGRVLLIGALCVWSVHALSAYFRSSCYCITE